MEALETWTVPGMIELRRKLACRMMLMYCLSIHQLSHGYAVCTLDDGMKGMTEKLQKRTPVLETDSIMSEISGLTLLNKVSSGETGFANAAKRMTEAKKLARRKKLKVEADIMYSGKFSVMHDVLNLSQTLSGVIIYTWSEDIMYSDHAQVLKTMDSISRGGSVYDLKDRVGMRGAILETATLLETDITMMSRAELFDRTPSQYGQITAQISKAIDAHLLSEQITDVFPGNHAYPPTMSILAKVILIYFCVATAYIISTLHTPEEYINAMVYVRDANSGGPPGPLGLACGIPTHSQLNLHAI